MQTIARSLLLLCCFPLGGCYGVLPETVYAGASLNEDGRTRTYNVGGTWRVSPAPVAKVADTTPESER